MTNLIFTLIIGLAFISSGCQKTLDLGDNSFVGATWIGDNLSVELNKSQITLKFQGKENGSISGQLMPMEKNDTHLFTLKERTDLQIVVSADDLITFATKDGSQFGAALKSSRKSYDAKDIAGVYNFVLQYYSENQKRINFGTFELNADYSWKSWRFSNGSSDKGEPTVRGHWVDSGKGEIHAFSEDNRLYATVVLSENRDLMIVNLIAKNGLALGAKQQALMPGEIDGDYTLLGSKGRVRKAYLQGETIFKINNDPNVEKRGNEKLFLTYNKPWLGCFTDNKGEILCICSKKGSCFCVTMGAITQEQYIVVSVKKK